MNILIAIPLKAKTVSKNWLNVEDNLKRTLENIKQQTTMSIHTVVCGHDMPSYFNSDLKYTDGIEFLRFDQNPPPVVTGDREHDITNFEFDRTSKIFHIFEKFKEMNFDYFFPLDADDLISCNFTELLQTYNGTNPILLKHGYVLYSDSDIIHRIENFDQYCGSSCLWHKSTLSKDEYTNYENFPFVSISHVNMERHFVELNIGYYVPDDYLIMYVRDNGDNISRYHQHGIIYSAKRFLKKHLKKVFFTKKIKKDFILN